MFGGVIVFHLSRKLLQSGYCFVILRSAANGKFFDSGTDYLRLQFLIATSSSLQLTGFPDQPYCFAASGSSSIAVSGFVILS